MMNSASLRAPGHEKPLSEMDREINYLKNRHESGESVHAQLFREINLYKERHAAQQAHLEEALKQQMESIEKVWNDFIQSDEANACLPGITSQLENLQSMTKALLNSQMEKQRAIDVALERLRIEEKDGFKLNLKAEIMQKKYESLSKKPQDLLAAIGQRSGYFIATGREPPKEKFIIL